MMKWVRRIRGAIGMGLTWAAAWFGAGLILLVVMLAAGGSADVPLPSLSSGSLRAVSGLIKCRFRALQCGEALGVFSSPGSLSWSQALEGKS